MSIKDVILTLCANLEQNLNDRDGQDIHKVKLICEMKPAGYFLPQIHPGTSNTTALQYVDKDALFVELWVDNKCLFRDSSIPQNNSIEVIHMLEYYLLNKLLSTIFRFGISSMDNSLLK